MRESSTVLISLWLSLALSCGVAGAAEHGALLAAA
jgi:hypothetical protein